jgi:uncharacterized repeat protein (TIGR01451 family)
MVLGTQGLSDVPIEASKQVINISNKTVTYQISIKNTDEDSPINNVTVEDILPNGLIYLNSTLMSNLPKSLLPAIENNSDGTSKRIIWNLTSIQRNQTKLIEFIVNIDKETDIYSNKARINGDLLGNPINITIDSDERKQRISSPEVIGPSLDVELQKIRDLGNNKRALTYAIIVKNTGETILKNVNVIDYLPTNIRYIESSCFRATRKNPAGNLIFEREICPPLSQDLRKFGTDVKWNLGKFMPDDVSKISLVVEVREGANDPQKVHVFASGDFLSHTYSTEFKGDVNWTKYTSNMVSQKPIKNVFANLSRKQETSNPPIKTKKYLIMIKDAENYKRAVTYLIEIRNVGETILKNVKVIDTLDANASLINCSCQKAERFSLTGKPNFIPDVCNIRVNSTNVEGNTNVTWNLGVLVPNELFRIGFVIEMREGAFDPLDNQVYATGEFMGKTYSYQDPGRTSSDMWT